MVHVNAEAYVYSPKTLEVATARVYNWDVTQKRKEKGEHGDERGPGGKQRTVPMIVPNG